MALDVAVICKTFRLGPTAAEDELDRAPDGWLDEVMEAMSVAQGFGVLRHATNEKQIPDTPFFDELKAIELEVAGEDIARG